jgi:phage shock protein E
MKNLFLIFIISSAVMSSSCSQAQDKSQAEKKTISVDSVKSSINKEGIVILDVRTPEEFSEGHVEGAVNLNYRNPEFSSQLDSLDKSKKYEVYCRTGNRSGESVKLLKAKGFDAIVVDGGFVEWESHGFPVIK